MNDSFITEQNEADGAARTRVKATPIDFRVVNPGTIIEGGGIGVVVSVIDSHAAMVANLTPTAGDVGTITQWGPMVRIVGPDDLEAALQDYDIYAPTSWFDVQVGEFLGANTVTLRVQAADRDEAREKAIARAAEFSIIRVDEVEQ